MNEETKDAEVKPSKPVTTPKPRKKPARDIKTRDQAIAVFMDMNIPYDVKSTDAELIKIAENVPLEKYYKIEIQPRDEFATKQAYCKVNGKSWHLERGVVHVVPERVITVFKNAIVKTVDMVDTATGKKIVERDRREEMISVLGEVPKP